MKLACVWNAQDWAEIAGAVGVFYVHLSGFRIIQETSALKNDIHLSLTIFLLDNIFLFGFV